MSLKQFWVEERKDRWQEMGGWNGITTAWPGCYFAFLVFNNYGGWWNVAGVLFALLVTGGVVSYGGARYCRGTVDGMRDTREIYGRHLDAGWDAQMREMLRDDRET